jgi:inorganic triphosphatase YgiF
MQGSGAIERPPREVEGTLLIRTDDPSQLRERLANLNRAGRFSLRRRSPQRIRDAYLDTPARDLGSRRIAVRLRDLDGSFLLAMKADSVVTEFATDRLEIEGEWSEEILGRILDALERQGVSGVGVPAAENLSDPFAALRSLGLVIFQDRETVRIPFDVTEDSGGPVAELAVDEVLFHFGSTELRVHEVEVEARGFGDADTVREVTAALRAGFPELRPWSHGKLATGLCLEALLQAGRLNGLIQPDGTLSLRAHDLLTASCK